MQQVEDRWNDAVTNPINMDIGLVLARPIHRNIRHRDVTTRNQQIAKLFRQREQPIRCHKKW